MEKNDRSFNFRMDEKTEENLEKQRKKYKRTKAGYLRNLINKRTGNKQLKNIERVAVNNSKILLNLSRVPANLNQIAYELHLQKFDFDEDKFYDLLEDLTHDLESHRAEVKKLNKALMEFY